MAQLFDASLAVKRLREKGIGNYVCPFCQGRAFSIQERLATISISSDVQSMDLGSYIPAAILICNKCGNMSFFALAGLGMLDKGDSSDAGEK